VAILALSVASVQESGETSCSLQADVIAPSDRLSHAVTTTATQVARAFIKAWLENREVLHKTLHFPTATTPQVGIIVHARRSPEDPHGVIIRWDVVVSVSGDNHAPQEACAIWWTPVGIDERYDPFLVTVHHPVLLAAMEEVIAHIADPLRGGQTCLALACDRSGAVRG
jgi:hypothetical protein